MESEGMDKDLRQLVESSRFYSMKDMSTNLAHDINNPLFLIQGRMHKLKREFRNGQLNEEAMAEAIKGIESLVGQISGLARSLSEFASSPIEEDFNYIKLNALTLKVLKFCQNKFTKYNIEIVQDESLGESGVYCYPTMAAQSLLTVVRLIFHTINSSTHENKQLRFSCIEIEGEPALIVSFEADSKSISFLEDSDKDAKRFSISSQLMSQMDGKLNYMNEDGQHHFIFEFPNIESEQ